MKTCPHCQSDHLVRQHEFYNQEVRKADPDLNLLERLAPPTRRASIHGFILGVLVWIAGLAPFFAPPGKLLRTSLPIAALALAWVPIFLHARRGDRARLAAYELREACEECGWTGELKGNGEG